MTVNNSVDASPDTSLAATVPSVTSVTPPSGSAGGGSTVAVSGVRFTGATKVRFGAIAATSFTVVSDTQISAVVPAGTGTVQVTVTSPGGTSSEFVTYTFGGVSGPTLVSVVPGSGGVAGGNTVTLTGTSLSGASSVKFGAVAASSFSVVSATQISAVVPAGAGTVQVTVTTARGTSNGVPYSYTAAPVLSSVTPHQGPLTGGNAVVITGTNLFGATSVLFGATPAASFAVVSATQITAVAPPGAAGAVTVTVTTDGGTSVPGVDYFYVTAPVLTGASPSAGPLAGGNTVTVTGSGLIGATGVTFGATAAPSFTVVSDVQINAVVPAGTGTVQIAVTTPGGTSNGLPYTYSVAPVLTLLNPDQGPAGGGNSVVLTGVRLSGVTEVMFGAGFAAFTVLSDTQVVAFPPPGAQGPVDVTVTAPGGTSPALVYTRFSAPGI